MICLRRVYYSIHVVATCDSLFIVGSVVVARTVVETGLLMCKIYNLKCRCCLVGVSVARPASTQTNEHGNDRKGIWPEHRRGLPTSATLHTQYLRHSLSDTILPGVHYETNVLWISCNTEKNYQIITCIELVSIA